MSIVPQGDYQSIMATERRTVSGKKFHVVVAGNTNNTHTAIVTHIINMGYEEVPSPESCDFILLFCPVVSRVGTDIGEALQIVDRHKDKALVVMHHTFNPDTAIAESRRQVEVPNVLLTVDFLFYENELLNCDRNSIAWDKICRFLAIPLPQTSSLQPFMNWCWIHKLIVACVIFLIVLMAVIAIIVVESLPKQILNITNDSQTSTGLSLGG